jgi:hypothetical protein
MGRYRFEGQQGSSVASKQGAAAGRAAGGVSAARTAENQERRKNRQLLKPITKALAATRRRLADRDVLGSTDFLCGQDRHNCGCWEPDCTGFQAICTLSRTLAPSRQHGGSQGPHASHPAQPPLPLPVAARCCLLICCSAPSGLQG